MPKQKTETVSVAPWIADLAGKTGADIPDRDPLLPVGTWSFDFIGYKAENMQGDNGPWTMITVMLDPSEAVDVDEEEANGIDWTEMRQFHKIFLMHGPKDARQIKRCAAAFGVDVDVTPLLHYDENGVAVYDMLDAAKGESGEGEVKKATNKKSKEEERRIYF